MAAFESDVVMATGPWASWHPEHVRLLERLLGNIDDSPDEPKFRRLKLENARIAALLEGAEGVRATLENMGWQLADGGSTMVLAPGTDLSSLRNARRELAALLGDPTAGAATEAGAAGGEPWTVTVLRGPLRVRVELPHPAHISALQQAIATSDQLGKVPRGLQRLLSGYPPKPLGQQVRLAEEGIKTVALEDEWELFVADLRAGRASFTAVAAALGHPCMAPMVLKDYRDFVLEKATRAFVSHHGTAAAAASAAVTAEPASPSSAAAAAGPSAEELAAGVRLVRRLWPRSSETLQARAAFCAECALALGPPRLPAAEDGDAAAPAPRNKKYTLEVDRSDLLRSVVLAVMAAQAADLRRPLEVRFAGEAAEDAGGPRRELFNEFGRAMARRSDLWRCTPAGSIRPAADVSAAAAVPDAAEREVFYRGCGRVFGAALAQVAHTPGDPLLLGVPPSRVFVRALQGEAPEDLQDLQTELNRELDDNSVDIRGSPDFCNRSLRELGLEGSLHFSYEVPGAGVVELVPGGAQLAVTDANKVEWLRSTLRHDLIEGSREATAAFRSGVVDVLGVGGSADGQGAGGEAMPLAVLTADELMEAWAGRGDVSDEDLETWRARTTVSPTVARQAEWLFELLGGELRGDRGRLLKFATGSDRWPTDIGSFEFTIEPMDGDDKSLPKAMLCGNMLQLPRYTDKQPLKDQLLKAFDLGQDLQMT